MERAPAEFASDHLIVGGGLAGGLIALALANVGRGRQVTLIEREPHLGGNHTWSFHLTDLGDDEWELVAPLVARRWEQQEVRFPGTSGCSTMGYATVTGARFAEVVTARLVAAGVRVLLNRRVSGARSSVVRFEDGSLARGRAGDRRARAGLDRAGGRGLSEVPGPRARRCSRTAPGPGRCSWMRRSRKRTASGLSTCSRSPPAVCWSRTPYSDSPSLDRVESERRILAYVADHGATVTRVQRRETGVLPLPLDGGAALAAPRRRHRGRVSRRVLPPGDRIFASAGRTCGAGSGERAHRRRNLGGGSCPGSPARAAAPVRAAAQPAVFDAMAPASRWTALDRFYRLPEATIARFYASRSTWADRARILVGRPPAGLSWRHLFRRYLLRARAVEA